MVNSLGGGFSDGDPTGMTGDIGSDSTSLAAERFVALPQIRLACPHI